MKSQMGRKIDHGNKRLKLDMVVRDEHGEPVAMDVCSVIELYKHHQAASERISQETVSFIGMVM